MSSKIKGSNTSRNNNNTKFIFLFQLHRGLRSRKWNFQNHECKYPTILLYKHNRNILKKAAYQLRALTSGIFDHTVKMVKKDDALAVVNSAENGIQN